MVRCDRSDSLGLSLLRRNTQIRILIISKEKNSVVAARAAKLRLPCLRGIDDKWLVLKSELERLKISPRQVAFMGNDLNDLECLKNVGLPIAVADAYPEVKKAALFITKNLGGHGAVREICDLLLAAKRKKDPSPGELGSK